MTETLDFAETEKILDDVKIPSAPTVLMEVHEILQRDEPEIADIAEVISKDLGMSALVMRTLNSPFFGLRRKIDSIQQATTLLGLNNIGNIVAGLALRRAMEESDGPNPDNFWDSPMNVALVSAQLAKRLGGVAADEAYLLGLFMNCGEAILISRFPESRELKKQAYYDGVVQTRLEDEKLNTNHAIVGFLMARKWGINSSITDIILRHHEAIEFLNDNQINPFRKRLIAIIKCAEYIDNRFWGRSQYAEWNEISSAILSYLELQSDDFDDILEDMQDLLMNT